MPLGENGKKILRRFERRYGKKKGKDIFYAWENKNRKKKEFLYD